MGVSRNIRDFTELVCECLSQGWQYTHGQPSEADLQHWARLGRATGMFVQPTTDPMHLKSQSLHLIRCKEPSAVLAGYRRLYRVGLWTAWVEDHCGEVPHQPLARYERFEQV